MCKNDILFANRLQNYTFLRTQPNKMHKNSRNVHTSAVLCNEYVTNIRLFLVVGVMWVVCSEVQTTTLLALQRPTSDEITHVDHVAQFADVATGLDAFEQAFRLLVKHIQTVPGWLTSLTDCVMSTFSSLVIVPSSFHSGTRSL